MRFRFLVFLFSVLFAFSQLGLAQNALQPLKSGRATKKSPAKKDESPTLISADSVEAKQGQVLEATGNAELRKDDQKIQADHLLYLQESKELFADGDVSIEQEDGIMSGPSLKMNLDSHTGEMAQPVFIFNDTHVRGDAEVMHIESKQEFNFERARYTSCPVGNDDWLLKMGELQLDRNAQVGTAYNARIEFMGVPFIYTPWMNFPLDDRRRSGLLGPILGNTNKSGREITLPFYWNISNNYDATLSPRIIERRGTLFDNEFRYMGNSYSGKIEYGELINDKMVQQDRSHSSLLHSQNFGAGFSGTINLNEASDDAYFRDLSSIPSVAIQRQLLREGALVYSGGGWWSASARAQSYQTLQDPDAPVALPYRRLPQINLGGQRVVGGSAVVLNAEYVNFNHPTAVNATRVVAYPSVSYPLINDPAYYLTPKFGVHGTQYSIGENNNGIYESSYNRTVPISSIDSGMTLERDFMAYEKEYVQTLEPRIYYVNIPYREQDALPIFDSAPSAFSFAQMFTENRFIGSDRIGDADQVTMAVTTRFLNADNGNELLRMALGQRFSRQVPRVVLGAPTSTTNQSDVLISLGGRMSSTVSLDSLAQYNPNESRTEMLVTTARYKPEAGKVFNLGYRYTFSADPDPAKTLKQLDFSTQWLLGGRWHMVGQSKYSLQEKRTVEALAGLEYNQDCWTLRLVGQHFVTATRESSDTLFIQLELNDMIRVGDDPLAALKLSIPGYTKMNDRPVAKPMQATP